ncbi:MAG: hypothetical protein QOD96_2879, partial [Pseudonocardiales bacterium]|nr:hypothetical protein [Pseudonocardiales bacterium]
AGRLPHITRSVCATRIQSVRRSADPVAGDWPYRDHTLLTTPAALAGSVR